MLRSEIPGSVYGGCGILECLDCWPLYGEDNVPIPGTEDGVESPLT